MKSTVITHVYNESYLLPIWIRHHRELFDFGVILDYNSTDNPEEIVQELAPEWVCKKVTAKDFNAAVLDHLVSQEEAKIEGNRITLTVTEFLLGDPRKAERRHFIPQILLINLQDDFIFDEYKSFHTQVKTGIGDDVNGTPPWHSRSMHQHPTIYGQDGSGIGRHYKQVDSGDFLIYRVSHCLVSDEMVGRRLQIQTQIPESDIKNNLGAQHHNWGKGLTKEDVLAEQIQLRSKARDVSSLIDKYDTRRNQ